MSADSLTDGPAAPVEAMRGENFPVALRVLPRRHRQDLVDLYTFARFVDDIGDRPGARGPRPAAEVLADLALVSADITRAASGHRTTAPELSALPRVMARCGLGREPFDALVRANIRDQRHRDYATRAELVGYCALSANPVGRLVLGAFGVRPSAAQAALSDDVCTALQILEHLQDVAEDAARGRIYLPREDRDRHAVSPADLERCEASAELRALVAEETGWALGLLRRGSTLVGEVSGWLRVALAGYVAGGYAAAGALGRARWDPLRGDVSPRRPEVARALAGLVMKGQLT